MSDTIQQPATQEITPPPAFDGLDALTQEERDALANLNADEENNDGAEVQAEPPATAADTVDPPAAAPQQQQDVTQAAPPPQAAETPQTTQPAVFPRIAAPENVDAQLAEITKRIEALDAEHDDGSLTTAEWRTQSRALEAKQREIQDQLLISKMSAQMREQAYTSAADAFLTANQQYKDQRMFNLLDAELRRIQGEIIAQGGDPYEPSVIYQAHTSLQSLFGAGNGGQAPASSPATQQQVTAPAGQTPTPAPAQRNIPPSFHSLPAAAIQDVGDQLISQINGLKGEAFEEAFAKLPPATREKILASQN